MNEKEKIQNLNINDIIELKEKNYGTIILCEEGCIKLTTKPDFNEININKLTVKKENNVVNTYDFLITSVDGNNAVPYSGQNGEDGKDGGIFTINIKNLDIKKPVIVRILGANGGNGACGKSATRSGENGENGGNGGKGGDGAHVYVNIESNSLNIKNPFKLDEESRGGIGGYGGDGGLGFSGKGGSPESIMPKHEQTQGGTNGNGGKGGAIGKKGSLDYIQNIDNDKRYKKPLNLSNDEEYNFFLTNFGGETILKKCPKIWNAIQKTRNRKESEEKDSLYFISNSYSELLPINDKQTNLKNKNSDNLSLEKKMYSFTVHESANVCNCHPNSLTPIKQTQSSLTSAFREINLINDRTGETLNLVCGPVYGNLECISEPITDSNLFSYDMLGNERWTLEEKILYYSNKNLVKVLINKNHYDYVNKPCFSHVEISEPNYHATNKKTDYIRFLYGRDVQQNQEYDGDSDYYGNEYSNNNKHEKDETSDRWYIPTTIIPIEGKILFKEDPGFEITDIKKVEYDDYDNKEDSKHPRSEVWYSKEGLNGTIDSTLLKMDSENTIPNLIDVFNIDLKKKDPNNNNQPTITFKLTLPKRIDPETKVDYGNYDWRSRIKEAAFLVDDYHENKCQLRARLNFLVFYKDTLNNNTGYYPLNILIQGTDVESAIHQYSKGGPFYAGEKATNIYIPLFLICWGCYATDTLIKTTDGIKKACEIQKGDKLPTFGGRILTVSAVIVGDEKRIYEIKTINNKCIRVSGGHAMKLYCENYPDGKKIAAGRIKQGDLLMTPEGNVEVESVETKAYNDKVYNFEFMEDASPNYIEANGFWSGDFNAQNESEKRELTLEQKEIHAEMELLAAELSQKAQQ